jgi:hypothetical protein
LTGVVYQKVEEQDPGVELPQVPQDPEHVAFAKRLTQPDGIARQFFGDRMVEQARTTIINELAKMGHRNAQVKVTDVSEDSIYFAVGLGTKAGLKVPVIVRDGVAMPPTIAIASGKVKAFTREGVAELMGSSDSKMLAISSPAHGMRPKELMQQVREAAEDGNFVKAEDAINVLGELDKGAQKLAISIFLKSLNGEDDKELVKQAEEVRDTPYFMTNKVFFPEGV